jgi:hypothetical protein
VSSNAAAADALSEADPELSLLSSLTSVGTEDAAASTTKAAADQVCWFTVLPTVCVRVCVCVCVFHPPHDPATPTCVRSRTTRAPAFQSETRRSKRSC